MKIHPSHHLKGEVLSGIHPRCGCMTFFADASLEAVCPLNPYWNTHPTHETVDVSDISYTMDIMCRHCHLADEALDKPCSMNPSWMVCI